MLKQKKRFDKILFECAKGQDLPKNNTVINLLTPEMHTAAIEDNVETFQCSRL